MNRAISVLIFAFLIASPSVAFCQFPWGALNNTIQQFNNGIALGQQQEAINNQREYLRQQAQALNQQNEIARQQLELQKQALQQMQANKTRPTQQGDGYTEKEQAVFEQIIRECPKDIMDRVEETATTCATRKETKDTVTYEWSGEWNNVPSIHTKMIRMALLVIRDKCNGKKIKRVNVTNGGELVAYADPKIDKVEVFR